MSRFKIIFALLLCCFAALAVRPAAAEEGADEEPAEMVVSAPEMPFPKGKLVLYEQAQLLQEMIAGIEEGISICGDGITDQGETCDDGNRLAGDGCSDLCRLENPELCGNGRPDPGEGCDDGNLASQDGCSALCQTEALCGDGKTSAGEQCDDGNRESGDGCSHACVKESADGQPLEAAASPEAGASATPGAETSPTPEGSVTPDASPSPSPSAEPSASPSASPAFGEGPAEPQCTTEYYAVSCPCSVSSCSCQCTRAVETCDGTVTREWEVLGERRVTGGSYTVQTGGGSIECDCATNSVRGNANPLEAVSCSGGVTAQGI
jgi:cysteine-rich repeat protein